MWSHFHGKKLNTRRELGNAGVQGGPVPRPHPEPRRVSNLTSKMIFLGQVYHVKWFSGQKVEYPWRTWTWTSCKIRLSWYLDLTMIKKVNFNFFLKKWNPPPFLFTTLKGNLIHQHMFKKRGGLTFDTNRGTPCIKHFVWQFDTTHNCGLPKKSNFLYFNFTKNFKKFCNPYADHLLSIVRARRPTLHFRGPFPQWCKNRRSPFFRQNRISPGGYK